MALRVMCRDFIFIIDQRGNTCLTFKRQFDTDQTESEQVSAPICNIG